MFHVIVNPAGAGGKTMKKWLEAEKIMVREGIPYDATFSTLQKGIEEIASELTEHGADLMIFGGDGTMNQVVNGIRDFEHTRVAFFSCGSGNDLARSLGMKYSLQEGILKMKEGKTVRSLDIGKVIFHSRTNPEGVRLEDEYSRLFNISSGIGFDAEICAYVQKSKMKKKLNKVGLGKMIYLYEALHVIFTTQRTVSHITFDDGESHDYPGLLFTAAMNEPYEGGGFRFGTDAEASDGLLDFCTGDSLSQWDFFRIFPYAYKGAHVRFKGVHMKKARSAEIRTDLPLWVHTDGEIEYLSDHITLCLIPEKLNMMI